MNSPSRRQVLVAGLNVLAAGPLEQIANAAGLVAGGSAETTVNEDTRDRDNARLWYRTPAEEWTEALPIGNGRLGAMLFGGVRSERIQLNESTVWAGGPHDYDNPEALAALPEIRRLIFEGKIKEAQQLANTKFMSKPLGQLQYQTVGDLILDFPSDDSTVSGYERELDLDSAIQRVAYTRNGTRHTREAFASYPDHVLILRLFTESPDGVSFTARFESPQMATSSATKNELALEGMSSESEGIPGSVKFVAKARFLIDQGSVTSTGHRISVEGARSVVVMLSIATNFVRFDDLSGDPDAVVAANLDHAAKRGYRQLRARHVDDYRRLFRRVGLRIGDQVGSGTTDERIDNYRQGLDPSLPVLYFNYGRYLMIACSRPGGKPATLQGLWNDSLTPPWGSKYTTNINTEMNYWPVETCNLSECHEPLFELVRDLSVTGSRTANVHYGARGWVLHHNTDQWRGAAPIDGAAWGIWQTGGAWLSTHLWQHYLFNGDKAKLAEHYPLMKGAAMFFVDALVEHPSRGWLVTCPSASPENSHHPGEGLCAGPTMDMEIVRDLFEACIEASKVLDTDPEFRSILEQKRSRLAPLQVGRHGQLQEWLDDWDEFAPEQHHRHVSHLYGLFPSRQINQEQTPDLFAAAKRSLEIRGDEGTGWSLAWKINLWARLRDGDHAIKLVKDALRPVHSHRTGYSGGGGVYPNLFDAHPPFQIDGNFGFASGLAEMLLQSHGDEIVLLPALPTEWSNGAVHGLKARGGIEVGIVWSDGRVTSATLHANKHMRIVIRTGSTRIEVDLKKGQTHSLSL
ncbi:MAG: glycoside hydrolase family 95 protein [Fimbriimonas sp.]|nr:glycoside hydrolase family 95 protein [Fimbriimonas sp.]